jgi:hypothetical protein
MKSKQEDLKMLSMFVTTRHTNKWRTLCKEFHQIPEPLSVWKFTFNKIRFVQVLHEFFAVLISVLSSHYFQYHVLYI